MPRLARLLLPLLTASLLAACGTGERWNVLLVTFDTTRADHIGCYGNDDARTPNLDALAADGVRFARAFATVPLTTPSHSSIMTGKYPIAHGVRDNGMFVLSDQHETLAEVLRDAGWRTGAAIAAFPLLERWGVAQGFEFYDDHVSRSQENLLGQRTLEKTRIFFDERPAGLVNEALLPWLDEHHDEPFFAWAHYFDPHQPLEPPPPWDQLLLSDPYLAEIAYADQSFGRLIERLKSLGVYDRTMVVMTADHGEGLGEHRETTHSLQIYNSTMHVPLIVRLPSGPAGTVVETPVSSVDILPTILDVLGVEPPEGVQGRSLRAEFAGSDDEGVPLYAETLSPRLGYNWGELRGLFADGYKYIFGPRPELFSLDADPDELENLVRAEPELAERMQRQLAQFLRDNAADDLAGAVEMDEETRQKLMALGYLSGSGAEAETIEEVLRPGGVPPQDRVHRVSDFSTVKQLLFVGQHLRAREIAQDLVDEEPDNTFYLELLATAEAQMGDFDDALGTLERIAEFSPHGEAEARLLNRMGRQLFLRGDYERAEELLARGQEVSPEAEVEFLLANIYRAQGEHQLDGEALTKALELQEDFAPARVDLAVRQARAGDRAGAAANFRQALRDDPYLPKAHYNYGAFLSEGGDLMAAAERFERAIRLDPRYRRAYVALVQVQLAQGQLEDAKRTADRLERVDPENGELARISTLLEEAS